jgi:hypothetical protein
MSLQFNGMHSEQFAFTTQPQFQLLNPWEILPAGSSSAPGVNTKTRNRLTPEQREMIAFLKSFTDYSWREIGKITGASKETCRSFYRRLEQ